VSSSNLRH